MRAKPGRRAGARAPFLLGAASAAVVLTASLAASAFCRTSSCPGVGTSKVCTPAESDDCGIPLFWPSPCVGFSLQKDASNQVSLDVAEQIFSEAFSAWTSAACSGGGHPRVRVDDLGPVECNKHEYNQSDQVGNANIIIFRDDAWPHEGADSTLALTTVTYNTENGEIYDADMEINSGQTKLTTGDTNVVFDLRSIVTHEAGHFLGLSHSLVSDATMIAEYKPGSTSLRDLSDDDVQAICDVYPPGDPIPDTCDTTPRHGFQSKCSDAVKVELTSGSCAASAGFLGGSGEAGSEGPLPLGRGGRAAGALALAALALAARRRAAGRA